MKDKENKAEMPIATKPAKISASKTLALTLLFLFMVLAIVVGTLGYQFQQFQKETAQLQKHFSAFSKEQKAVETALKDRISLLSHQLDAQQSAFSQINMQLSLVMKRLPGDSRTWKIMEVETLIHMAQITLNVQYDIPKTLTLLKQAENHVNSLQSSSLENLHVALLKNISILQTLPIVDSETLTAQLTNLRDEVGSLSILVAPKPNTTILEETPRQLHKKWWQQAWDNIKASLQQLVIVRHQEEKISALLAPEAQMYLQENLQLLLVQAQWALLHRNAVLYQKSLTQAKNWVEKYYVQNSASTQGFLKQLHSLMNQNISPTLPDLSQMLDLAHEEER